MHFEKERLLNLAGLGENSSTGLMTESVNSKPSTDEQKLRRLVREELTRILQEREEENIQHALKHKDLSSVFRNGTPGYVSGMVHGNEGKVRTGKTAQRFDDWRDWFPLIKEN